MIPNEKECYRCKIVKPKEEYYTRTWKRIQSLQSKCRQCDKLERRQRYNLNKKRELKYGKLWQLRNGRNRSEEYYKDKKEHQRALRLAVRLSRAKLLINLCIKEWDIKNREDLNGRCLVNENDEQCVTIATWLIRSHTLFSMNAITEMFNCSTGDTLDRIHTAVYENSFNDGDILVIDKCRRIRKSYQKLRVKNWHGLSSIPEYLEFTEAQRETKNNVEYNPPDNPPENMDPAGLVDILSWYYRVDRENFFNMDDKHRGNLVKARQVFMYLMYKYNHVSQAELAVLFSRDGSTINHGVKIGSNLMSRDKGNLYYEIQKKKNPVLVDLQDTPSILPTD